jgi:hypothetical protein
MMNRKVCRLTVDDEDASLAVGVARDVEEVNVVLGDGHHRAVALRLDRRRARDLPSEGGRVSSRALLHAEEGEAALGQGKEDVGVVVEDDGHVVRIDAGGVHLLDGPGCLGGVEDVDGGSVGGVGAEDVHGVEVLREVACRLGTVEGTGNGC